MRQTIGSMDMSNDSDIGQVDDSTRIEGDKSRDNLIPLKEDCLWGLTVNPTKCIVC